MATRQYDFIVGPETSTLPTVSDAVSANDIAPYSQIQEEFAQRASFFDKKADVNAIKAISSADRSTGQLVLNYGTGKLYYFDGSSTATADDDAVIQPTSGSGRWLRQSSSGGAASAGSTDAIDIVIDKCQMEHFGYDTDPLTNSIHKAFRFPETNFNVTLLEDYTATGANMKIVVNSLAPLSTDFRTDSATGWTAQSAGNTLTASSTAGDFKIGTAGLKFNKNGTATTAYIDRTTDTINAKYNANFYFWIKPTAAVSGTLTNVFIRVGSASGNYRQWTFTTDYAGSAITSAYHLIKQDLSDTTGSTTAGSGWTVATSVSYLAIGVTTDAGADTLTGICIDAPFFADSTGGYVAVGDELTIYNASTRDTFVIDSASTSYNGLVTLAATLSNSYSAVAATVCKRNILTAAGDNFARCVNSLSGTIADTQEIRLKRALAESFSGQAFDAFVEFDTAKVFEVTSVSSGVNVGVETTVDWHLEFVTGNIVEIFQKVPDGFGKFNYVQRNTTYTLDGNSSHASSTLTIPLDVTTGITVGDILVKRQINCDVSLATLTGNESFTSMTRDRLQIIDIAAPVPQATSVWAHWTLSGSNGYLNSQRTPNATGPNLTIDGTLTYTNTFKGNRYATSGWSGSNAFEISTASSEAISGDSADCTSIACSIWVYCTAFTGSNRVVINRATGTGNGWRLNCDPGANQFNLFISNATAVDNASYTVGAWNHVYFYIEDNVKWEWYVNGVNQGTGVPTVTDSGNVFVIGAEGNGSLSSPATGMYMSDVFIWRNTTELTQNEVNLLYNNGAWRNTGSQAGLKYFFSKTGQVGQKLSLRSTITRETDADDIAITALGVAKGS